MLVDPIHSTSGHSAPVSGAAPRVRSKSENHDRPPRHGRYTSPAPATLVLDRKKLPAFSAAAGRFLHFPIGDRRCNRTRASVGNAGGNARPSLTNATLAASRLLQSRLLHRRSPTAPCSKGAFAAHRKKLAAFSALGGDCGSQRGPGSVIILRTISRSALTSAIRRFVSSPLSACAGALSGGLEAGLDVLAFCFRRFMLFTIR